MPLEAFLEPSVSVQTKNRRVLTRPVDAALRYELARLETAYVWTFPGQWSRSHVHGVTGRFWDAQG